MLRMMSLLVMLGIVLSGCRHADWSIGEVDGQIERIAPDHFDVDCTDEVNIGKKGAIDSIGYGCRIAITDETTFQDDKGNSLKEDDFVNGTNVKVVLATPVNIRSKTEAKEPLDLVAASFIRVDFPAPPGTSNLELLKSKPAGRTGWQVYQSKDDAKLGLTIYYTSTAGEWWTKGVLPADEIDQRYTRDNIFLSAPSDVKEGWVMVTSDPAAGLMEKKLFTSEDVGTKWRLASDLSRTVDGYVTGVAFKDDRNGWVAASYHGEAAVPLYRTQDGGLTWHLQQIDLPAGYNYGNAFPPVFDLSDSKSGTLKIEFHNDEGSKVIRYATGDGGATWITADWTG
jgi:hypothetical protein